MTMIDSRGSFKTRVDGGVGWVTLNRSSSRADADDMQRDALAAVAEHIADPAVSTIVIVDFPAGLLIDRWQQVSEQLWNSSKTLIVRRQGTQPEHLGASPTPVYIEPLTERERQVLSLACTGASARAIGERLFISERTVESHVSNGYRKLGIRSRVELVRRAIEFGL